MPCRDLGPGATLEATQGQMLSQSPTDANPFWWHVYGSWLKKPSICPWVASRVVEHGHQVGRNTVASGVPVTVTVTQPIPCYRSREGLISVCLASGNQRRSCCRSR